MEETTRQTTQLHDDNFLEILWDENKQIIEIDRKDSTSAMIDQQFKAELALFAGFVEQKKARGLLVDVSHFRHKMAPDVQEWRLRTSPHVIARPAFNGLRFYCRMGRRFRR